MEYFRTRFAAFLGPALVMILLGHQPTFACDCVGLKAVSPDVRREAPFIFTGTVVEIVERAEHTTTTYDGGAKTSVRPVDRRVGFRVIAAWRGVARPQFDVVAELSDCMFPFEIGSSYLVFAHRDTRGRPWTTRCTRTGLLQQSEEVIRALGEPSYKAPSPARDVPRLPH